MTLKEFEKSDWDNVLDPVEPGEFVLSNPSAFDNGMGVTVLEDDKVLGCGGIVLNDNNNGEVWLKVSKSTNPRTIVAGVLAGFKIIKDSFPDVTIRCRALNGFDKGHRLIRRLGFVEDFRMKDCVVYK